MSYPGQLFVVSDEAVLLLESSPKSANVAAWDEWAKTGLTVRMARGRKMRTVDGLFDEMAAAVQFPWYFGENWAAFEECLAENLELPLDVGIVILILDAIEVLADAPEVEMEVLVRVIERARKGYSHSIELGKLWDRPAVPFHVVLQATPRDSAPLRAAWQARGAAVAELDSQPPSA